MPPLDWNAPGKSVYETGVDRGVLYLPNNAGDYNTGFAWVGLTTVTESPSGAEASPQYADNRKYLNLVSAEEFGATIEAFTYPDEFAECDGTAALAPGLYVGQQGRRTFGFSYRTLIGNDLQGTDAGYKLHLVYGCLAAPSEKTNTSVNDSPEAGTFSWEVTTTAVPVGTVNGKVFKPTAHVTVDSTEVNSADLAALEAVLYGRDPDGAGVGVAGAPRMPRPADVYALFTTTTDAPAT